MKTYNITKGQLITLWIIGVILVFTSILSFPDFIGLIIIPLLIISGLIFYTIGWNKSQKRI